jgi:hypothetical protein
MILLLLLLTAIGLMKSKDMGGICNTHWRCKHDNILVGILVTTTES